MSNVMAGQGSHYDIPFRKTHFFLIVYHISLIYIDLFVIFDVDLSAAKPGTVRTTIQFGAVIKSLSERASLCVSPNEGRHNPFPISPSVCIHHCHISGTCSPEQLSPSHGINRRLSSSPYFSSYDRFITCDPSSFILAALTSHNVRSLVRQRAYSLDCCADFVE
jgi:hypothetical protein